MRPHTTSSRAGPTSGAGAQRDRRLRRPIALTIAGSDPSGGAGIQADLKTFHQHKVYGMAVVTLATVQSTQGVARVLTLPEDFVAGELRYLLADGAPDAAKTGALGNAAIIEAVASELRGAAFPLVVDPVMVSKHGHALLDASAVGALKTHLLPLATLVTPNAHEAAALCGREVTDVAQARYAAQKIADLGAKAVLVKGGHLRGQATDVLWADGAFTNFSARRKATVHTHGTGCTLSAAIVARIAQGASLRDAVRAAKSWLTRALATPPRVGQGIGPVDHFAPLG